MIEFLTPEEMAKCDRLTIADGVAGIALMEKAGGAVADAVARHPLGTRVLVVSNVGPFNPRAAWHVIDQHHNLI